ELVRACQREGLVRLERDRRGGLRVFPGAALQRPPVFRQETQEALESELDARAHAQAHMLDQPRPPSHDQERAAQPIEAAPSSAPDAADSVDVDVTDSEPMPTVDPTAELLGTASRRRRSSRSTLTVARTAHAAPAKKTAARKPAAHRKTSRSKASNG